MAFTACFIVGLVTYFTIPVSLLPDIAIPEITIQVSGQNTSARELENTVVKPIRQQLMQVAALRDIHSETRDGAGIIRLSFDFGTNTDLAFIEVNEKIDAAMTYLLFALESSEQAEQYIRLFCKKADIARQYVNRWLPIVAAAQLTKKKEQEKEILMRWIDVIEYQ